MRIAGLAAVAFAVLAPACVDHSQVRLRTAVDAHRPALDQCYEAALAQNPSAAGRMKLLIHVPNGARQVDRVQVGATDRGLAQQQFQQCIANSLVGLPIDAATLAELSVEYTLSFEPDTSL